MMINQVKMKYINKSKRLKSKNIFKMKKVLFMKIQT
jgi:hypothetical protein